MPRYLVGGDVDAWCNRCQLVLAHTIHAIVAGKIRRVHCNTCKQEHAFRTRAPGEKGAARERIRVRTAAPDYDALLRGRGLGDARPYSTRERFEAGALLSHPTFGLGVVTDTRDGRKIEVCFPQGARTLAQGR
ncbi:MAG TPA: hypothetical protein DEP35_24315 [Deltaproteobacteria bacterium]|nr:hypothetical protein [Deltaproteobacteria bacterium]